MTKGQSVPPEEEEGVWRVTEGELSRQERSVTYRADGVENLTYNNPYDSVPGMENYSPLWQFNYVIVPRDYEPNALRSEADCLDSGYPIEKGTVVEN